MLASIANTPIIPNYLNVRGVVAIGIGAVLYPYILDICMEPFKHIPTTQRTFLHLKRPVGEGTAEECQQALAQYGQTAMISRIARGLGGIESFCNLPVLPWQERFSGRSEKIDGIQWKDAPAPIMRGVDPWNRLFINVKTESNNVDFCCPKGYKTYDVETLHERYGDANEPWIRGQEHLQDPVFYPLGHIEYTLQLLAKGESIKSMNWLSDGDRRKKLAEA